MGKKEIEVAKKAVAKRRKIDEGIHGQITIKLNRIAKEVEALRRIAKRLRY